MISPLHRQRTKAFSSLSDCWSEFTKQARLRIGALLKADNVSFLLGAGASKDAGGVLLGSIPKEIEQEFLKERIQDGVVKPEVPLFYAAVNQLDGGKSHVPTTGQQIVNRRNDLNGAQPLKVNFEAALSLLWRWRSALPEGGGRMILEGPPRIEIGSEELDRCIGAAKVALVAKCVLPAGGCGVEVTKAHKEFLKKVLTRPLNLKRVNVFTVNYDTLIEQAADAEGVVLMDGFVGSVRRVFRPESYDQDLYFPAQTTEGRVHRLDRVLHLYKLHGSTTWKAEEPSWDNPYGVLARSESDSDGASALIYPTPAKFGDTLGMPYSELLRRFASSIVRPQSTLFVVGCSLSDEHIRAIVRQALAIPSFALIVVDPVVPAPDSSGEFLAKLRAEKDRRVWIISGESLAAC